MTWEYWRGSVGADSVGAALLKPARRLGKQKERKIKANIHLLLVVCSSQGLRGPLAWRIEWSSLVSAEGRTVWSTWGLHRPTSLSQHAVADLCPMCLAVKERNEEDECTVPLRVL